MADKAVMAILDVRDAIAWQAEHAEKADAPITGRVVRAERAILDTPTELARRMLHWPGLILEDAMPLRVAGGLHWLHLSGAEPRLAPVYAGAVADQAAVDEIVAAVALDWDARLLPWLDHPPGDSPMRLTPVWRGPSPPAGEIEIVSIRGCDVAPVDLSDPAEALRLKAYVWPDAPERMARIDAAARLAAERPPLLERADAGEFVKRRLAATQDKGVVRVLYHSVMWQYLPEATRRSITAAMEDAGSRATAERPLAWVRLETNRETFRHELSVRYWPGGETPVMLCEAHPHGAWIEWRGQG
jgi:hypothetical protein